MAQSTTSPRVVSSVAGTISEVLASKANRVIVENKGHNLTVAVDTSLVGQPLTMAQVTMLAVVEARAALASVSNNWDEGDDYKGKSEAEKHAVAQAFIDGYKRKRNTSPDTLLSAGAERLATKMLTAQNVKPDAALVAKTASDFLSFPADRFPSEKSKLPVSRTYCDQISAECDAIEAEYKPARKRGEKTETETASVDY